MSISDKRKLRGAAALAKSFGISPLVIGLTVVAFGTSAPELSVNLLAVFQGDTQISFGNIIGNFPASKRGKTTPMNQTTL